MLTMENTEVDENLLSIGEPKLHGGMCKSLSAIYARVLGIYPELEGARPRSTSGIQALCALHIALEKTKNILQHCAECSKLYLAITGNTIVLRFERARCALEDGLKRVEYIVPQTIGCQISDVLIELHRIKFSLDPMEKQVGDDIIALLQQGSKFSGNDNNELESFHQAASRLVITSSRAALRERSALKKLVERARAEEDKRKESLVAFLLHLMRKYSKLLRSELSDDKPRNCNSRLWHEKNITTLCSASQITGTPTFLVASENESMQKWKYDAFLSFRGEDTRNGFVSHLFKRLQARGINAFKDDVKLQRGKFISPELLEAIEKSKTAIIIFSENYASSTWCLEELTKIMECVEKKRQKAIPVFYDVEPSDVRRHRNSFARALAKHEADLKDTDLEKVQRWKDALCKAAGICGWDVRRTANGNEAECIDLIINENFQNMHCTVSATEKYLVGIQSRVGAVESSLEIGSGGVRFVGIWGMGGVGKTTIARKVFDKISQQFQRSCFLEKVKDESKMHGLKHLQKILLSRILNEKSIEITGVFEGASMIKRNLCLRKVLIVFDDVDDENQLENLVGMSNWFGDGSRIIITTRDSDLLRKHNQLYLVPELSMGEALELFSLYAFQKPTPDLEFLTLSKCIVDYTKGLPLALKVLGSFLYKRGINEWISTLDRLEDTGNKDVIEQLTLSLDGLTPKDRNVFLDIACFFRGKGEDDVKEILESFGLNPEIGMDVLAKRSLLYISEGMVEMHDLIEQMGQQVTRDAEQDKPWNHTRLWHEKDIKTVFSRNQRAESIRGIVVPAGSDRYICKFSEVFRNMPCLRLLIVKGEEVRHHDPVPEPIKYLPSSLIWLDWRYYTAESLPSNFEPENLVALKMTFGFVVEIFKEPKDFDKLKILNLSFSESLLRTPNFSDTPHLQRLILKGCVSLIEVHPSIGNLKRLIFLDMENCKNLESLPSSFMMESLESFNLSGCEKLGAFPEIKGKMNLLSELLLGRTAIWELASSIGRLSGISLLDLRSCKNLVTVPTSISEMRKLRILNLKGCSKLETFPENLGNLQHLEELHAGNTAIRQLPDSIQNLSKLEVLSLRRGHKCEFAWSLILPSSFGDLQKLKNIDLSGCNLYGDEVNALILLPSLLELNLSGNKFTSISDSISQLCRLQYLNVTHCQNLKGLPKLPLSIEELYADDFLAKQSTVELPMYPRLNLVSFTGCTFDQQAYTKKYSGLTVLDEIFCLFLSNNVDDVIIPSLSSNHRVCALLFSRNCQSPCGLSIKVPSKQSRLNYPIIGTVINLRPLLYSV